MNINVRNSAAATVSFQSVTLDGQSIGPFAIAGGQNLAWNIQNYDFSDGFTLNGTIVLTSAAYGGNENSKVEITVGEMTPITSTASTSVCAGDLSSVSFTGLLPNKTYQLDYDIDGVNATSPNFTTNASGSGGFTIGPLVAGDFGKTVNANVFRVNGGCSWSASVFNSTTLVENLACLALPVTWTYFKGYLVGSSIQLEWETAQEQGSAYFAIEESVDQRSWEEVGRIQAAGNSNRPRRYSFSKAWASQTALYIRLRQVDVDGRYSFSRVVRLERPLLPGLTIVPNPASNGIRVQASPLLRFGVRILNLQGRLVWQGDNLRTGDYIDMVSLPRGVYLCQFIHDNQVLKTEKLVKN